jgi:peptide/nickel transport system permease protein
LLPFVLRRLLASIPVLLGVTFLVVAATKLIPGSPGAMKGMKHTKEEIAAIDSKYGYDRPLSVQYASYCERVLLHGDLGESWATERPVLTDLVEKFPATIELAFAAMLIATFLGVGLGVLAALKPRSALDYAIMTIALTGISLPIFWLGVLMQSVSPTAERVDFNIDIDVTTRFYVIDAILMRDWGALRSVLGHLALPAIALATIPLATVVRLTRSSLLEALQQDYVRTARAKGLSDWTVVMKHAMRNALIPIVTAFGLQLAALLGGAVLTETVFSWPGVGSYIVDAATNKDLPALQGAVLVVSVFYTLANLVVDLSYGLIDPRVRVS